MGMDPRISTAPRPVKETFGSGLRRRNDRAIGLSISRLLLLGNVSALFLKFEARSAFLSELHCFDDPVATLIAVSDAGPRPAVPLYVGALRACDIVPMLVKVGLVDTELSDVARSNNLGGWPTDCGVAPKPYLATALWYAMAARDDLDFG